MLLYCMVLLMLFGTLAGLALLPDQVVLLPTLGDMVEKNVAVAQHFGICALFAALFWKWPRELSYFLGEVLGLLLMVNVLYQNLG